MHRDELSLAEARRMALASDEYGYIIIPVARARQGLSVSEDAGA